MWLLSEHFFFVSFLHSWLTVKNISVKASQKPAYSTATYPLPLYSVTNDTEKEKDMAKHVYNVRNDIETMNFFQRARRLSSSLSLSLSPTLHRFAAIQIG